MGGKNPTIVLADALVDDAVNVVVNAAFFSTGQRCTATSRVIVEEPFSTRSPEALVERTSRLKSRQRPRGGHRDRPSIDKKQLETVLEYVGMVEARAHGDIGGQRLIDGRARARLVLVAGGADRRHAGDASRTEEIFGPVLPCCLRAIAITRSSLPTAYGSACPLPSARNR